MSTEDMKTSEQTNKANTQIVCHSLRFHPFNCIMFSYFSSTVYSLLTSDLKISGATVTVYFDMIVDENML